MIITFLLCLKAPTVTELTKDSFFSFATSETGISVIHFYGRNCPACVDAEPTYEELSRMYHQEPRMRFGQLDCDRYSDVCDSTGAQDRPAWLVWLPGESHSKRYNRNIDTENFERWLRQQTGIWPTSKKDNLLYENSTVVKSMTRKSGCIFTIVDKPRMDESQPLHNASRSLEKRVKRGVRFVAVDAQENKPLAKELLDGQKYGAYLHNKGRWTKYDGPADSDAIRDFLKVKQCGVILATPTPTPEPLPELPDLPDEEYVPVYGEDEESPADRARKFREERQKDREEAHKMEAPKKPAFDDDDDLSEWSEDDDDI